MGDKEPMFDGDNTDTDESQQDNDRKPEGGWGWVVCCGTFSVNFIVFGIHNSFGVVYEYLVDEQNMGEAETGDIISQTTCGEVLIDKTNILLLLFFIVTPSRIKFSQDSLIWAL